MFRIFLVLACASLAASAQEAARPQLRPTPPSPLAPPADAPSPQNIDPVPLIPEDLESAPKPEGSALTELKPKKPSQSEGELAARIRLRDAKTRALRDPRVQAEWDRAQSARTYFEKREALTSYYKLLYDRIAQLDGSLKKRVVLLREASIKRISQRNIDPTDPVERRIAEER